MTDIDDIRKMTIMNAITNFADRITELESALAKQRVANEIATAAIRERLGTMDQLPVDNQLLSALRETLK